MPSTVVLLLSAALALPSWERVVLLTDPATPCFEQSLVRHMLMQNLLADASVQVRSDAPVHEAQRRAAKLHRQATRQLQTAEEQLHRLHIGAAIDQAAKARQKWMRVAQLTGDCTALADALPILASALMLQGAWSAADDMLDELLTLEPSWRPSAALFNPHMKEHIDAVRQRLAQAPTRPLAIAAPDANTALFVDGVFVGFGQARVPIVARLPHWVWALGPTGAHASAKVPALFAAQRPLPPMRLDVVLDEVPAGAPWPNEHSEPWLQLAATPASEAMADSPLWRAWQAKRALIVSSRLGEVCLTHLQPAPPYKRRTRAPAIVTDLRDAKAIASQLLAAPPTLAPAETPAIAWPPPSPRAHPPL